MISHHVTIKCDTKYNKKITTIITMMMKMMKTAIKMIGIYVIVMRRMMMMTYGPLAVPALALGGFLLGNPLG